MARCSASAPITGSTRARGSRAPGRPSPDSGAVVGVTQLLDGTIVGVGTDHHLYLRATLASRWVPVPDSGAVTAVLQLQSGRLLGIGTDHQLYARTTVASPWSL